MTTFTQGSDSLGTCSCPCTLAVHRSLSQWGFTIVVTMSLATESPLALKRRARRINRELAELHPDARCELNFTNPLELLVATVLSAQCTDARVNKVTPALFERFTDAEDYAEADIEEVERYIRSTGFYHNKAKNLVGLGQKIVEDFGGEVPSDIEDLVTLPGVGRKTAHVIRGHIFGLPGLPVDTHFGRLCRRLGLTNQESPLKVEKEIGALIEPAQWTAFSDRLVFHGRRVCFARSPHCWECGIARLCPSATVAASSTSSARKAAARKSGMK